MEALISFIIRLYFNLLLIMKFIVSSCLADTIISAYLLFLRNKDFLGLLDHRLRFELLVRELVFTRVEQLSPRHAGQDQVCGIRLEINIHLDGVWVDGGGCSTLAGVTIYRYGEKKYNLI